MRSARTNFLTIAFVLSSATAVLVLRAAESAPAAAAPAPEKIEFSRSTSTTPKIPRPGLKTDDRFKNYGNVQDGPKGPEFLPPVVPNTAVLPSKAAAKKLLEEWDRKKNWAVPTDNDADSQDPLDEVDKPSEDNLTGPEKPKSVMAEFVTGGSDSKRRVSGQSRSRDLDRDTNRRDNRLQMNDLDRDRDRDDRRDENDDSNDRDRDPNDNSESNGLAAFNLKKFIREQNGMSAFKDQQLPRAAQLFRSEIGNNSMNPAQLEKDRADRQARSAEFMQMLKPRASGSFAGNDPVNAPDLTRREANPVTPRPLESSSQISRSPFNGPSESPASRIQDNAIFGVTGPAASSVSPALSAPAPRPVDQTRRQIVIDAPRRIGF